ncbi:hypothetical protein COV04_01265 [Candidatus Uhrbacteria bacterium CG10_big_fil_rev_8_21_14_0_10_48_11]|uniref:Uncharacterized protein n=1 Tax=Candidatus Uhrbacteria bacterium CG10_big_fil_rev_8_21_14_0_10_48_11 TaxID=1975037 RepID=A0A2M8LFB5_9BACT|nr:MAG: hypothetical protein COV04_01265 [Candidatus Uhrbacteria bacterium CG10_big_fil_rev_8_21_14_0_10_48_11]
MHYEDIDALKAQCGGPFGAWSLGYEVTASDIVDFAAVTGDDGWLHTGIEQKTPNPFGAVVAQSALLVAFLPKLMITHEIEVVGTSIVTSDAIDFRFVRRVTERPVIVGHSRLL